MKKVPIILAAAMLLCAGVSADESAFERVVGDWISPDGAARQRIESHFDGSWVTTQMWFKIEGEWQEVSRGAIYPGPEPGNWVAAARTSNMNGIELFQSTIQPGPEVFKLEHRTYMADGTMLEAEEEWSFPNPNRIEYEVRREGDSKPWFSGTWVRQEVEP